MRTEKREKIIRDKTPHEGEVCYYPPEPTLHEWTPQRDAAFLEKLWLRQEGIDANKIGSPAYLRKKRGDWIKDQRKAADTCRVCFYPDGMGMRLERRLDGYSWKGDDSRPTLKGEGDNRHLENPGQGYGKRGKVNGFSRRSAARMLDLVWKLDRNALPVMVTLTYPDDWQRFTPEQVKIHLDCFIRKFEKRYKRAGFLWKLEFQDRGAPHYHLLIWNAKPWHKWVAVVWWKIVGSGDRDHLNAGTRVEALRSYRGTLSYCGKNYLAKGTTPPPGQAWGRLWGVRRKERLPWAECVEETLPARVGVHLARLMRRYHKSKGRHIGTRGRVSWMLTENQARWVDALEWAYGVYNAELTPTGKFRETPVTEVGIEAEPVQEEIIYGCREARDEVEKWGLGPLLQNRLSSFDSTTQGQD